MGASVGALFAVALGGLAIPRFVSAIDLLPGNAALELVQAGARPSDAGMVRAIDAQTRSLAVMPRAGPHADAGYLTLALIEAMHLAPGEEAELAAVARYHVREALTLAPAQARAWLMLASLELRGQDIAAAANALALSFVANPHAPNLGPLRWPMAMSVADRLDRATREQANLEFLSYFRAQPDVGVRIALRTDRLAELRALTVDRGQDGERLRAALGRIRFDGTTK